MILNSVQEIFLLLFLVVICTVMVYALVPDALTLSPIDCFPIQVNWWVVGGGHGKG